VFQTATELGIKQLKHFICKYFGCRMNDISLLVLSQFVDVTKHLRSNKDFCLKIMRADQAGDLLIDKSSLVNQAVELILPLKMCIREAKQVFS